MTVPICPLAGRLKYFLPAWKLLAKDQSVLWLSRRVQDPSPTRTKANVFPKTSTMGQRSERTDRVHSKTDVGEGSYLQSFTSGRRMFQSNISSRGKGWRQQASNQSNLCLNKLINQKPQQMCALSLFQNGGCALPKIFITKLRLHVQNRLHIVPLSKESRKFVRFQWEVTLYEVLCLCLGLAPAARGFTKLLKVPISLLRRLIFWAIIFLDDLSFFENTIEKIFLVQDSVIVLLQHFLINFKKCILEPTQEIEFLGMIVNSKTMTLSLPQEKIQKIKSQCLEVYRAQEITLLELTRLLGTLTSTI